MINFDYISENGTRYSNFRCRYCNKEVRINYKDVKYDRACPECVDFRINLLKEFKELTENKKKDRWIAVSNLAIRHRLSIRSIAQLIRWQNKRERKHDAESKRI